MTTSESEPQVKATSVMTRPLWLLWVLWTLGTTVGMFLFSLSFIYFFPIQLFAESYVSEGLLWKSLGALLGASAGMLVGLCQFLTLKYLVLGHRWLAWVPLGVVSFCVAIGVHHWFFPKDDSLGIESLFLWACMGLVIGGIQAPFLAHRLPGIRWWMWIVANILAWPNSNVFRSLIMGSLDVFSLSWALNGLLLGMVTGAVLVYYVRQTSKKASA